jgi:cytochrome b
MIPSYGEGCGGPQRDLTTVLAEIPRQGIRGHEPNAPGTPDITAEGGRWVRVWNLPTRLFHWLLVLLVATGVFTGFVAPEWWMGIHVWAGYGLVALMAFRLVWGIFGSEYSRVVSFIYPPRDTFQHLRGLLLLRPPHYVGHNPTGALMVFALTGLLIALVVTGLLAPSGEEKQRITETPRWVKEHREVRAARWGDPKVKSKANCVACHTAAEQGLYED